MNRIDYEQNDPMSRMVRDQEAHREDAAEGYARDSHDRLKKHIKAKITTTMIGALSLVEQKFGPLWGQGKPRTQMTEQELQMEALKDELRTDILNQGNNQLRAAMAEIDEYEVQWKRHHYSLTGESQEDDARKALGINEDGSRKKLRHGTNPDGSIKVGPSWGPGGRYA